MKKIEELFASLSDHQLIIDGLSEIKVEAINKYWLAGKLQQPKDADAGSSEIKRLLLIAFAPEGSLPAMYRNAPRLRTSPTYKADFQYYRNEENFEPAGTLSITKDFEVLPTSFYQPIYDALQIKTIRIASDAYESHFSTEKIDWLKDIKSLEVRGVFFGRFKLLSLPENIGDLKDLEELTVIRTEISAIPESLFDLANLKKLDIKQNKITSLGSEVSKLKKLETLDVSMNQLARVPDELTKLKALSNLKVYDNPFIEISDAIAFQTYRYNLQWDANSQTHVELIYPKDVLVINKSWIDVSLSRIEEIISKNKITTVRVESVAMLNRILTPDAISHFKNIRCLDLQWNSWSNLQYEKGFFKEMAVKIKLPSNEESALIELPEGIGLMNWLEELNLQGNKLKKLPAGIFELKELKKLNLSGNKLEELPDSFSSFSKLVHLNLSSIEFAAIPESIFSLSKLISLDLSWNRNISELSPLIANLKNIEELDLETNALTSVPVELGSLKNLKVLAINQNQFTSFPESICELSTLEELNIGNQKIAALPSDMKGLKKLKKLIVESAEIQEIPDTISDLKSLEILNLKGNDIVSISESIGDCQNLTLLDLQGNACLEMMPESVGTLSNLEELNLYGCKKLLKFPTKGSNLKKLRILNLSDSLFTELPEAIFEIKSLIELRLTGLPISKLDKRVKELKNLEYLSLSSTKIVELPAEICELKSLSKLESSKLTSPLPDNFGELSSLKSLDVNFEEVGNPFPKNFGKLKNLEYLSSWSKGLNELPESFNELDGLKRLCLRYTHFKELPLIITELKNIGHLDLMYNTFEEVPEELAKIKSLYLIHFDNNPLGSSAAMKKKCAALLPGVYFSF